MLIPLFIISSRYNFHRRVEIACDMKKVELDNDVLDVAVFSLSLMGKNWIDYIIEAKRCLDTNGYLLIVETTKSMKGRLSKLRCHNRTGI